MIDNGPSTVESTKNEQEDSLLLVSREPLNFTCAPNCASNDTFFKTMPELMVYWALPVGGLAESGQSEDPPHIIKLSFLKSIVPCPVNV